MKYSPYIKTSLPEGFEKKPGKTFIYVFRHPQTSEIRYVGKSKDPRARYWGHMKPCNRSKKFPVAFWVNKLFGQGLYPIMELIEIVDDSDFEVREKHWISHYKTEGCRLLNLTAGGEGSYGVVISEKTRIKKSLALMGHPVSAETRQLLREAKLGCTNTLEGSRKTGEGAKRAWAALTPEARIERVKGLGSDYERTAEIREKASATKRGKRSRPALSPHLGVTRNPNGTWAVHINNGRLGRLYLGCYRTEAGAASAFNRKSKEIFGNQAMLNTVAGGEVEEPRLEQKKASKYKGVVWHGQRNRWIAVVRIAGKPVRVGSYTNEDDAARAYDAKARELGLDVPMNFP